MELQLPSRLVLAMQNVKKVCFERFATDRSWLYTASSPEFFNDLMSERIAILNAQFGFYPDEHHDWVDSRVIYVTSGEDCVFPHTSCERPLSSWTLKNPVIFVPTLNEMLEWSTYLKITAGFQGDTSSICKKIEGLHERYTVVACHQLIFHSHMLDLWKEIGSPREQEDCPYGQDKKIINKLIIAQRNNLTLARKKLEAFSNDHYPQFMIDQNIVDLDREEKIYMQLKEVWRRLL